MSKSVRVLIADDHDVVREGVRVIVEREPGWEVVGQVANGADAVQKAEELNPDLVALDMSMPELNGLEAARRINRAVPTAEVLILTAHESDELIREVFEAGAKSYILKSPAGACLMEALRSLAQHKPYFTNSVSAVLFARMLGKKTPRREDEDESAERLTGREREIVQLLSEGLANKEVADKLDISLRTVEMHRATVMRKLQIESLAELVRYAIRNKMIEP